MAAPPAGAVPLRVVASGWARIGITGFGGPPAHIALLRQLVVEREKWLGDREFEDAIAACNLLPGPASTQLAIFCARRVAGARGAVVGGLAFVVPAITMVLLLSLLFLAHGPPAWVRGAGAGAGAIVAAVALCTGLRLLMPSWNGLEAKRSARVRWLAYSSLGGAAAALLGPYLVVVLLGCGFAELALSGRTDRLLSVSLPMLSLAVTTGGIGALAWVAFKVGALSYGGGFVIVPLMQRDAVHVYHWMTSTQFLNAVALGQVTPGPVVATVAAVGYAAHGVGGSLLAALIAFLPSFVIVLVAGGQFERLRASARAQAFLRGAGPAAIGAILGAAIPLAAALRETWQILLLAAAAIALLVARSAIVATLVMAGTIGAVVALAGGPVPR